MSPDSQCAKPSSDLAFSDQVALFIAVRVGDTARVRDLLARAPGLVDAAEDYDALSWPDRDMPVASRSTPLIRAVEAGHLAVVQALLEAGAAVDGDCGCPTSETALWAAVVTGREAIAGELLRHGADPNRSAASGIGALHAAAIRGDGPVLELLLRHGADRHASDRVGRSPADWARLKGHDHVLALLDVEAGPPGSAPAAPEGALPSELVPTGIKALDLFAPLRAGAFVLVHGSGGVGRNVFLAELAEAGHRRGDTASIWVTWDREAWSEPELDALLMETQVGAHVHVIRHAHSADALEARHLPARALALAERLLRDGTRHVQLTLFEPPGMRAAIEALLPSLGRRDDGRAISAFVVAPWQVAEEQGLAYGPPFDACIVFDRELAEAFCFPAIDAQLTHSRWLEEPSLAAEHAACAAEARALLAELRAAEAAAAPGPELQADEGTARLRAAAQLRAYLTQPFCVQEPFSGRPGASVPLSALLTDVRALLDGRVDQVDLEQLAYRGTLD